MNYRFKTGSRILDNKAVVDLSRLEGYLSIGQQSASNIILLGFADSDGDKNANLKLSKERAQAVADALLQRGVNPGVITGFGDAMPIASNESEEGRQRNRRVEVWVRKK